jgi:tRNA-specific 2-thiouridylase
MFVLEIRPESREVVVGTRDELFSTGMQVTGVSWLTMSPPEVGDVVRVQIRHRALDVAATIIDAGLGDSSLELHFAEPQRAVTPGQSAAIFLGDRLLGGGRIARALVAQLRPVEPNPAPPRSLSDSSRTSSISGVS